MERTRLSAEQRLDALLSERNVPEMSPFTITSVPHAERAPGAWEEAAQDNNVYQVPTSNVEDLVTKMLGASQTSAMCLQSKAQ